MKTYCYALRRRVEDFSVLAWGDVDDYYSDPVEIDTKRDAFDAAGGAWETAIYEAVDAWEAGRIDDACAAMADAGRIELEWGDTPATDKVRSMLVPSTKE